MQAELAKQPAPKPQVKGSKKDSEKRAGSASASNRKPFDREAAFKQRDVNQDHYLTLDEFLRSQRDIDAAASRFPKFDKNNDGKLSADEFVGAGKL